MTVPLDFGGTGGEKLRRSGTSERVSFEVWKGVSSRSVPKEGRRGWDGLGK